MGVNGGVVPLAGLLGKKGMPNPQGAKCQKCLQVGHWTYECTNKRKFVHRSSRTSQLNKRIEQLQNPQAPSGITSKDAAKKKKKKKSSDSGTSSSSSDSESDSSDSSDDSNDSSDSSSSDSSSSSSSSDSSDSSDSSSSSDTSDSDSSSNSSTDKKQRSKKTSKSKKGTKKNDTRDRESQEYYLTEKFGQDIKDHHRSKRVNEHSRSAVDVDNDIKSGRKKSSDYLSISKEEAERFSENKSHFEDVLKTSRRHDEQRDLSEDERKGRHSKPSKRDKYREEYNRRMTENDSRLREKDEEGDLSDVEETSKRLHRKRKHSSHSDIKSTYKYVREEEEDEDRNSKIKRKRDHRSPDIQEISGSEDDQHKEIHRRSSDRYEKRRVKRKDKHFKSSHRDKIFEEEHGERSKDVCSPDERQGDNQFDDEVYLEEHKSRRPGRNESRGSDDQDMYYGHEQPPVVSYYRPFPVIEQVREVHVRRKNSDDYWCSLGEIEEKKAEERRQKFIRYYEAGQKSNSQSGKEEHSEEVFDATNKGDRMKSSSRIQDELAREELLFKGNKMDYSGQLDRPKRKSTNKLTHSKSKSSKEDVNGSPESPEFHHFEQDDIITTNEIDYDDFDLQGRNAFCAESPAYNDKYLDDEKRHSRKSKHKKKKNQDFSLESSPSSADSSQPSSAKKLRKKRSRSPKERRESKKYRHLEK